MHLLPSFFICASGPWALDWNLHYGLPWFSGFWIQAKLCHWLFCFSSLPKVSDGTLWPQWLHETIPIMNLSIYHACVCLSECLCVLNCLVTRLFCPWESPGKNTTVGCHALLLGIFLTQESNPSLLHWQAESLPLSPLEGPIYLSIRLSISEFIHLDIIYLSFCLIGFNSLSSPKTSSPN